MYSMLLKVGAVLLLSAALVSAGWTMRGWKADSDVLLIERAAVATANKTGDRVVGEIGKLRPVFTTITQKVQRETFYEPRYLDASCNHTDAVWLQISAAYEALGLPPLDRGSLPAPAAPGGSQPSGLDISPN